MPRATADLGEIVRAVDIQAAGRFAVLEDIFETPAAAGTDAMTSLLASVLYQRLYCRPSFQRAGLEGDSRAARLFVDRLSQANSGTGTWEAGWVVTGQEADGALAVSNRRHNLLVWAQPEHFRPANGAAAVGAVGRLRLGKELREMLPGYYTVLGDADQPAEADGSAAAIVRYYWHLTSEIAPAWVSELTHLFNGAGVAFRAKVLSDPRAYLRADAGVLYVAVADAAAVMALLPDLHRRVSPAMRPATPMLTKRLARGLGVAEDPGDSRSFGQHRCQLVAEGLVRAFQDKRATFGAVTEAVAARFAEEGLTVTRPWLSAGSRRRYAWSAMGPATEGAGVS